MTGKSSKGERNRREDLYKRHEHASWQRSHPMYTSEEEEVVEWRATGRWEKSGQDITAHEEGSSCLDRARGRDGCWERWSGGLEVAAGQAAAQWRETGPRAGLGV